MTFFGRMHHLPEVSHQGDLLYSKAILQLAGKLNGGDEAFSTHVLMATLTLTVHEVCRRPPMCEIVYLGLQSRREKTVAVEMLGR